MTVLGLQIAWPSATTEDVFWPRKNLEIHLRMVVAILSKLRHFGAWVWAVEIRLEPESAQ